jgi:HAD superfamily hydrolase (TIGR01509 family)
MTPGAFGSSNTMVEAVFFDVDGTLIDNTYFQVIAWSRACRDFDLDVDMAALHRLLGMGADQFIPALLGHEMPGLAEAQSRHIAAFTAEARSVHGATELLQELQRRGFLLGIVTSGDADATDASLRRILPDLSIINSVVCSDDIAATKPAPDLIAVALQRSGASADGAILVGDTRWDVEAAARCGVRTIGVRSGGHTKQELMDAGAIAVYDSVFHLLLNLDASPLHG